MRDGAIQHVRQEARTAIEERDRRAGEFRAQLEAHAMGLVEDARRQAVEEVHATREWAHQHQNRLQREMELEMNRQRQAYQQMVQDQVQERDNRIQVLEAALVRHQEAVDTPVPISPSARPSPTPTDTATVRVEAENPFEPIGIVPFTLEFAGAEGSPLPVHPTTAPHAFGDYLHINHPPHSK